VALVLIYYFGWARHNSALNLSDVDTPASNDMPSNGKIGGP
jgi:hypothetical protein